MVLVAAGKAFSKILPQVDLVVEVLDARLPGSSSNPMLAAVNVRNGIGPNWPVGYPNSIDCMKLRD